MAKKNSSQNKRQLGILTIFWPQASIPRKIDQHRQHGDAEVLLSLQKRSEQHFIVVITEEQQRTDLQRKTGKLVQPNKKIKAISNPRKK